MYKEYVHALSELSRAVGREMDRAQAELMPSAEILSAINKVVEARLDVKREHQLAMAADLAHEHVQQSGDQYQPGHHGH